MFGVIQNIKRLATQMTSTKWIVASAAAVALATPALSQAADRGGRSDRDDHRQVEHREPDRRPIEHREGEHRDFDHHDRGPSIGFDLRIGPDFRPGFRPEPVRVWVAPVYRTVTDRQWIEPVYQTVTDQVLVPDQFEDREVRFFDAGAWRTRIDRVLVAPAHYENQTRQVCVTPGYWQSFDRQELVVEGHYDFVR